jgi:hypothetical protein
MATQRLIIDSKGSGPFLLQVDGDVVTVSGPEGEAARVLESLHVVRIHCVLDVEAETVTVRGEDEGAEDLQPGETHDAGGCRIRLQSSAQGATPAPQPAGKLRRRLVGFAGPEEGRDFPLPDSGIISFGKDRNQVDVVLRGLRVERIHCHLRIADDSVEVVDQGKTGTLVNGKRVTRQQMKPGDILKIDNNQLRLEAVGPGEEFPPIPPRRPLIEEPPAEEELPDEEPLPPLPADASEPVRLLNEWRRKLPELSGHDVGHYKLGKVLERGRYGVVFRATDSHTGQVVALKLLSPQFPADNAELQRFAAAVKVVLPLRHDHIVTVFAVGKNAPITWIAREHVEGESLRRVLRRQEEEEEYDAELAVRVGLHVARALVFARQHRIRHGALTPANIIVRASDQVVKVTGLMLDSALEGSELASAVRMHRSPAEVAYLSPEQATPGAFVDESSDMYALGAVLYALLTGRPPFVGKTAEEVLAQIRGSTRVERPSTLNREIPPRLEQVVVKLLAKLPEDRYATPAELLADLEPIAAELGVED